MVVLARHAGLPARLVNGFAGGRRNPLGGFVEVTNSDAHAWVEIHYSDAGWVRYDPTPPDLRLFVRDSWSLSDHMAALSSTVELWWFQQVVDFDSSDQIQAVRTALTAWRKIRSQSTGKDNAKGGLASFRPSDMLPTRTSVGLILCAALAAIGIARRRSHKRPALPASYEKALAMLSRNGIVRPPAQPARGFAQDVSSATPGDAGAAFAEITEEYLALRFGDKAASANPDKQLARLASALREHRRLAPEATINSSRVD
jgi:hypothetical protein